jgi:hypothetical protein
VVPVIEARCIAVGHGLTCFEIGNVQMLADAGKGSDPLRGDTVEVGGAVAEALGHGSSHLEMRVAGDGAAATHGATVDPTAPTCSFTTTARTRCSQTAPILATTAADAGSPPARDTMKIESHDRNSWLECVGPSSGCRSVNTPI